MDDNELFDGLTDNQILTMKIERMKLGVLDKESLIDYGLLWRKMDFMNNKRLITLMMMNQEVMDYESMVRELQSNFSGLDEMG